MKPKSPYAPIWKPSPHTRMAVSDFVAMHGGPKAMSLPEHEHSELQIEAHFSVTSLTTRSPIAIPDVYRLIPSGKPHTGQWKEGSEVVVLLLDTQQLDLASDELLYRAKYSLNDEVWGTDSVIHSMASALRREFLSGTTDSLYLEAIRTVLSGHLARSFANSGMRKMRGRLSPELLRKALEMIEEKLESGLSISDLAQYCGMGVHHFTRLFKASTGQTPYRFITEMRISRAKHLLANSSLSLAEIAYGLGFASQSHLSTSFRQHTQITPQLYRSSVR